MTSSAFQKWLLKKQREYRRAGKSSEWLAAYARGATNVQGALNARSN